MATPIGLLSQAALLAKQLGINTWQIQTGSYNGVAFHIVPDIISRLNKTFNPAAGIIDSTKRLIGVGNKSTDNTNLPYGTIVSSTNISDSGNRKLIVHAMPNSEDIFEDLGWYGETITIIGVLSGNAYTQALNNILNIFMNDEKAAPKSRNVLVHPIFGTIENVYLQSYKRIHNPNMWRSCIYEFTFRTSKPVAKITSNVSSALTQLNNSISALLAIVGSLLNTWNTLQAIEQSFGIKGNTTNVQNALKNSQTAIQQTTNVSVVVAKLMVDNLKPTNYNNVALNNYPTTSVNNLPFFNYYDANMTPADVNTIIEFNNDAVNGCIEVINQINNNLVYDSITQLLSMQSQINQLGLALLNSFYGGTKEYVAPFDTDLFNICFTNNLDYNTQASVIWQLNKGIITTNNFIKKGTILIIPIPSESATRSE